MMWISYLPAVNATLNAISFVLLVSGYVMIRRGRRDAHRRFMTTAFGASTLFLTSYLTYKFLGSEKKFGGVGPIRLVYFFILITHVVLAATVPFLAIRTLLLARKGDFVKHRKWARVTFPIWIYVSITGVVIYIMLFRIYGPAL